MDGRRLIYALEVVELLSCFGMARMELQHATELGLRLIVHPQHGVRLRQVEMPVDPLRIACYRLFEFFQGFIEPTYEAEYQAQPEVRSGVIGSAFQDLLEGRNSLLVLALILQLQSLVTALLDVARLACSHFGPLPESSDRRRLERRGES